MADYADVKITFTPEEWAIVNKPLSEKPWGSWQNTLAEVQRRTNKETLECTLNLSIVAKCEELATSHGGGGYQGRFRTIIDAIRRRTVAQ